MRKTVLITGLAALALTSCSQEEVLDSNAASEESRIISFRSRTATSSRANDITTDNLQSFKVIAYKKYLPDVLEAGGTLDPYWSDFDLFSGGEDGIFRSATPHYWPADGELLTFLAYAPADVEGVTHTNLGELKIDEFTVADNISEQVDLIIAEGGGGWDDQYPEANDEGAVGLSFQHALSKVYISSACNNNEEYEYEVAGVRFGNIHNSGSLLFNDHTMTEESDVKDEYKWTALDEQTGKMEYIFETPVKIGAETTPLMDSKSENGSFLLIPQQLKHEVSEGVEDDSSSPRSFVFKEGVSYIALLVRIIHNIDADHSEVAYPYAKGVENITVTIDGEKYAWAAFPVGTKWVPGCYVDYFVDFSNGPGFVAPGGCYLTIDGFTGEEPTRILLDYKPILGGQIIFTEDVNTWNEGTAGTVDNGGETDIDQGDFEDPGFEDEF